MASQVRTSADRDGAHSKPTFSKLSKEKVGYMHPLPPPNPFWMCMGGPKDDCCIHLHQRVSSEGQHAFCLSLNSGDLLCVSSSLLTSASTSSFSIIAKRTLKEGPSLSNTLASVMIFEKLVFTEYSTPPCRSYFSVEKTVVQKISSSPHDHRDSKCWAGDAKPFCQIPQLVNLTTVPFDHPSVHPSVQQLMSGWHAPSMGTSTVIGTQEASYET